jgi:hypothetical protein
MKKQFLTRKIVLSIVALILSLAAIPAINAVTDADIQNGSVMYFVLANNTQNMNGATVKDWSGRANGTIGNMLCPSGSAYCSASLTNSYITFTALALGDQTAFFYGTPQGNMVNEETLTKDNTGSNFIMVWGATGAREMNTYGGAYTKSSAITGNVSMRFFVKRYGIHVNYFVNGTNVTADADGSAGAITTGQFGRTNTGTARGNYYLLALWNRTLSDAEIAYFDAQVAANNSYNPFAPAAPPVTAPTIAFNSPTPANNTPQYKLDNDTIQVNVSINNQTGLNSTLYLYLNGTGLINTIPNSTSYNFTGLAVGTYFINASLINSDGSTNTSTETRRVDVYNISNTITTPANNTNITRFLNSSFSASSSSNLLSIYNHTFVLQRISDGTNYTLGSLNYTFAAFDYDTLAQNFTIGQYLFILITADDNRKIIQSSKTVNLLYNSELNITARYIRDNSTIMNFTINITDNSTGLIRSLNTTTGYIQAPITKNSTYLLVLDAEGYAITNETYTANNSTFQNTSIEAYTNNAVDIYIYDETTFLLITNLVYVTFTSNATETIYNTSNGTLYRDGLIEGTWSIKFSGSNYTTKTYSLTVGNRSFQTLNAYLSSSYSTVIFTITNIASGATLEGASVTMERLINSTWTIVESKLSDITGRAQFSYLPAIKYKFTASLTGYSTKIFYLDPIIFSSYTVGLTATASTGSEADYSDLSISHYPKTFFNNAVNNITFIISSPTGKLLNYSFNVSAPGGNNASEGILANGESFLLYFNISAANFYDRVNVSYSYITTEGSAKNYFFQYEILGVGTGNYTISQIKTTDYGLGMFEKAFIAMIFICILAGGAYLIAGMGGSLLIGLIAEGFAVYLGFLPLAAFLISALAGFLLIVSGGIGGKS